MKNSVIRVRRFLIPVFAIAFIFAGSSSVSAQWKYLSFKIVDKKVERDTMEVGASKGLFRAIRFKVSGSAVRIFRVQVRYENGEIEEIDAPNYIRNGGQTRALDLRGKRRRIDTVSIWYRGMNNHKATIRLYGRS